eukprot:g4006.t1
MNSIVDENDDEEVYFVTDSDDEGDEEIKKKVGEKNILRLPKSILREHAGGESMPLATVTHNSTDVVVLTTEVLSVTRACDEVCLASTGATATFIGTTRNNFNGRVVTRLEYEAYEPMAIKEMKKICVSARERFVDISRIAVYHRLGVVKVKEASIVIAVSSPHRKDALDAVAYIINTVKATVPIWKKEIYADGTSFHGHHGASSENNDTNSIWKENKEFSPKTSILMNK